MTEKLFWQDPYQTEFTAKLLSQFPVEHGQAIILDRTCFYATSGGQPHDRGLLESLPVTDVVVDNDRILHIVPARIEKESVNGVVDWIRRFDHMQQHSGQHILSAAFFKLFQAETSSFHLGEEYCSIELNQPNLNESRIRNAEQMANEVILYGAPVTSFFIDPDRAQEYNLRKKSDLAESLRIIQMGEFDLSPCSGTHVRNTSEIGVVFIYGFEKLSQSVKITFLCGNRVRRYYARDLAVLKALSKTMTTSFDLLPSSVAKLQSQVKELRKENFQMKEGILRAEALQLVLDAEDWNGRHLIIRGWNRPYEEVRYLAQRLSDQKDVLGALWSSMDNRIVFFRNRNDDFDLRKAFDLFLNESSARGGGPAHFLEAGGFAVRPDLEEKLHNLFAGMS